MASNVANRKTYRAAIAAELATLLVGSGKPAQSVFAGHVGDFSGVSPAVIVSSGGSAREGVENNSRAQDTRLYVNVTVLVAYADEAGAYDELDSENALDDIEKIVSDWVGDNRTRDPGHVSGVAWTELNFEQRTETGQLLPIAEVGGQSYRIETIPLVVRIMGQP